MKKLFIIPLLLILLFRVNAQESSIGLRCGGLSAVTYKYVDEKGHGFELMLGQQKNGMKFTGLVERHRSPNFYHTTDLKVYTGIGGHVGYTRYMVKESRLEGDTWYYREANHTSPVIGGDFILGAEYTFERVPVSLSLDYKPYVELFGEENFRIDLWDFGFSVRYIINNLKS